MDTTGLPTRFPVPFANAAGPTYTAPVPTASPGVQGRASLNTGFPPETFVPVGGGGTPPFGQDFNGLLQQITAGLQWTAAGGCAVYDATFQTAIGGYPQGAVVQSALNPAIKWRSYTDNNTNNPDTGGAGWVLLVRTRLTANLTLYVSPTGSDTNDGLTAGTPFATLQHAWVVLRDSYDLNGFVITVQSAAGSFAAGLAASGPLVGATGPNSVVFLGNTATPASYIVNVTNGNAFAAGAGAMFTVQGFTVAASGSGANGHGLTATTNGLINYSNITFGICGVAQIYAVLGGKVVGLITGATSTIAASSPIHAFCDSGGTIDLGSTAYTLTGTPAFSTAFAFAQNSGLLIAYNGVTFSGAATGTRHNASNGGGITTLTGNASFFPGSSAGAVTSPGYFN